MHDSATEAPRDRASNAGHAGTADRGEHLTAGIWVAEPVFVIAGPMPDAFPLHSVTIRV